MRYTNLIFVEHEKLLTENSLLYTQIGNYQEKLKIAEETDSLRVQQLYQHKQIEDVYCLRIDDLTKSISKKDRTILGLKIGCVTVGIGAVLLLLLK